MRRKLISPRPRCRTRAARTLPASAPTVPLHCVQGLGDAIRFPPLRSLYNNPQGSVRASPTPSTRRATLTFVARETPTYSYPDLADRIAEVLGTRPALSTLRSASAREQRPLDYPPRLTAGMPRPIPSTPPAPARFRIREVEQWLATHPWVRQRAALDDVTAAAAGTEEQLQAAVAQARAAGASWTALTAALQAGGWPHGRAWTHRLFRDL